MSLSTKENYIMLYEDENDSFHLYNARDGISEKCPYCGGLLEESVFYGVILPYKDMTIVVNEYDSMCTDCTKLTVTDADKARNIEAIQEAQFRLDMLLSSDTPMITHVTITKDGVIYSLPRPNRHHNVYHMMNEKGIPADEHWNCGFLDSTGKYYNREEAGTYALEIGQVNFLLEEAEGKLFSENLW